MSCEGGEAAARSTTEWTGWSEWSTCSVLCGDGGFQTRTRTCTGGGAASRYHYCSNLSLCEIGEAAAVMSTAEWTEWSEWSTCSVLCGNGGFQSRTRTCTGGGAASRYHYCSNLSLCEGGETAVARSTTEWTGWSEWSTCSVLCGDGGFQTRTRTCTGGGGSSRCVGNDRQWTACNAAPCQGQSNCLSTSQTPPRASRVQSPF